LIRYKFIGHSTVLVDIDSMRFITDPIVSKRALVVRRKRPAGYDDSDLSDIHFVLLSHAHWDHLDRPTLRKIAKRSNACVICPRGHRSLLEDMGFREIHEMGTDEVLTIDGYSFSLTPVNHRGKRWLERYRSSAGIFIKGPTHSFWFAGDTGYRSDFSIGMQDTKPDVALIPIGAYEPREWFHMMHMDPQAALQTFYDVQASYMLPIHWGAFKMTREEIHEPPLVLRSLVEGNPEVAKRIWWLEPGDDHTLDADTESVSESSAVY
jgi:N-acyl-phosphatidylethanolamine-hydrolysing phospholipase D